MVFPPYFFIGAFMINIMTGSTLGGAEYVADHLSDILEQQGFTTTIHYTPNSQDIENSGIWLIITSTHGAGEYPDNIKPWIQQLQNTPPKMDQVKYAVIAIGDSSYDTFCAAGKHAFDLLKDIGATPISDCFVIDVLSNPVPEEPAENWLQMHLDNF